MENLYDHLNDPLYYPLIVQHCPIVVVQFSLHISSLAGIVKFSSSLIVENKPYLTHWLSHTLKQPTFFQPLNRFASSPYPFAIFIFLNFARAVFGLNGTSLENVERLVFLAKIGLIFQSSFFGKFSQVPDTLKPATTQYP